MANSWEATRKTYVIERHPRNRKFAWRPTQGPYTILTSQQARQYDEHGYFVLQNAFTHQEIDDVARAIDPFEEEVERMLRAQPDGRLMIAKADAITFTVHLVKKSPALKAFSKHPVFAKLCNDIMGLQSRLYWDQAVYKKPGNPEEFPWHQDNGYTFTEPQQYLTCWVALVDATVDNGCPWVVPGVHRMGTLKHEATPLGWQCLKNPEGALPAPAKKGDIVVFSSLTPHRTGPNLTDGVRKSYILQYAPVGAVSYPGGEGDAVPQDDAERQYIIPMPN
jgi:ectoine hydroxylase-related dioxygenase (phytanoyl-CoA dioxygenase family)